MRLITDIETQTDHVEAESVFADPVSYLATLGIKAELVAELVELPEAA